MLVVKKKFENIFYYIYPLKNDYIILKKDFNLINISNEFEQKKGFSSLKNQSLQALNALKSYYFWVFNDPSFKFHIF